MLFKAKIAVFQTFESFAAVIVLKYAVYRFKFKLVQFILVSSI